MGALVIVALLLTHLVVAVVAASPKVIIVGAGFSGISAAKTLSDAGITDLLILEATDHIGGRIHKVNFAGINVEKGANWVEGVGGDQVNPIFTIANELKLRRFYSDYSNLSSNTYKNDGGYHATAEVQGAFDTAEDIEDNGKKFSTALPSSGSDDISILTYQRLKDHVPSTPVEMVVDYYSYDYEFAEPPRVTSLQNTVPLATFANFGDDVYFVADQRGYESVVYHVAGQFLKRDKNGKIIDPRLKLNKVSILQTF